MSLDDRHYTLIAAGWNKFRNNPNQDKWWHANLPTLNGRRRPFSTDQALTLLDAVTPANDSAGREVEQHG